MSIPEVAPVGSVVGRIWARDRDTGVNAEMEYSIIDGDGRDTFAIATDPTHMFGIITVKRVRLVKGIVREEEGGGGGGGGGGRRREGRGGRRRRREEKEGRGRRRREEKEGGGRWEER